MVFAQGALGVVLLGFLLFCLLDVITTEGSAVRHLPKIAWILLVVLINPVGGIAWLAVGRPQAGNRTAKGLPRPTRPTGGGGRSPRPRASGPIAPDDDPEFLAVLRRREEELRRKQRGEDDSIN